MVEYDRANESIIYNKDTFAKIVESDGIYIIGIKPESTNYVKLLKYMGRDLYNTLSDVKANAVGVTESLITINGKDYLIMALVEGDIINPNPDEEVVDTDSKDTMSYAWIFYVLGVLGLAGGSFLIVKLKKKTKSV